MTSGSEHKVLIVEDDSFLTEILIDHFQKFDLNFELAADGEQALKKIKETKIDLVLLDLIMPGIDGYEVLRQLKADPDLAKIPVVVFSNLGQKEEIEKAMKLGAVEFLVKSQTFPDEVIKRIKQKLEERV